MAVPIALMAAGTAIQVLGQYQANLAQAQMEKANAEFYKAQADFAREAQFRQAEITARNYEYRKGAQLSAYAKGGVEISGSAAVTIVSTLANKMSELVAIKRKGELEVKLALARSRSALRQAETLEDPFYNIMQAGGTILTNTARAYEYRGQGGAGGTTTSTQVEGATQGTNLKAV